MRRQSVYTYLLFVLYLLPGSDHGVRGQTAIHQLWDIASLNEAPSYQWLEQNAPVRSFLYKSVDFENRPTEVFAYYSNPDMLSGRPKSERKYPALVLVHGAGGTAFKEWVEKWAAEGYAAVAMDLSGRDGKGKRLENTGPGQAHDDKFTKIDYSNDITSPNETRKWNIQKAEIDQAHKTVTTTTPKEGFKYGFFYIRDNRNVSGSSEFIIND